MKILNISSWNVNGIRAVHRKGALVPYIDGKRDIICIQETKANEETIPPELESINNYYSYFSFAERKGYSGVAIYSKNKPLSLERGIGIDIIDREGRTLIADYGSFVLLNIYFPNGKASSDRLQYKMEFYDAFLDYVDLLIKKDKNIVICGDVNTAHKEIDLARPKENAKRSGFLPEERAWIDKFLSHGFIDTFRMFNNEPGHYTWWDLRTKARNRNIGWRIDYFFVSENIKKNVTSAYILPDQLGSDHCPIGINIKITD